MQALDIFGHHLHFYSAADKKISTWSVLTTRHSGT
jgi:hypothetical protein